MDYSELVRAVQEGDERTVSRLCSKVSVILKKYMIAETEASPEDAEDAVQKMFEYVIQKIRNGEIKRPGALLAYMLKGTKHAYYKSLRDSDSHELDEHQYRPMTGPGQLLKLIDEERKEVLEKCIRFLKAHYRALAGFLFDHPDAESEDIAEHFDISVNNAWTRKHRVIKQLRQCAENHK
jgi:DNA-directed RNA polymerase specialized sigma24 family protein